MSIEYYDNKTQAAALVTGIVADDIEDAWRLDAKLTIDSLLGYDIDEHTVENEYYDVKDRQQISLAIKNWPLISITAVTDDAQGSIPSSISLDDILIDEAKGIIYLKQTNSTDFVYYFTRGRQSVKITYVWGWATVPTKIAQLATLLVARHAQHKKWEDDYTDEGIPSGGFKQFKLSEFSITLDSADEGGLGGMPTKFDGMILNEMKRVKATYARDIHIVSTSAIGVLEAREDIQKGNF